MNGRGKQGGEKREPAVFRPFWPERLEPDRIYTVHCDDVRGALAAVFAKGGDLWLTVSEPIDEEEPEAGSRQATIRIRQPFIGGGASPRTHQALLWLADAIRRDGEENARRRGE